jgi:alpha-beta hydrolase superfamily lysophospholipase
VSSVSTVSTVSAVSSASGQSASGQSASGQSSVSGQFVGAGGLEIFWQSWREQTPARAVVVISHGAGEHSGRYARVALALAELGYPVYALDHRGHGRSQGRRALVDRLDNAAADLDVLIDLARREHPDIPLFLLGHSLGGTIALRYALRYQEKLDGLILSGPVAAIDLPPAPLRLAAKALSAAVPWLGALAVDPAVVSRDPAEVEAYRTDPLVHHGKLPVRTVAEIAAATEAFPEQVASLTLPLLLVHGSEDRLSPVRGSRMVHERASSEDKTLEIYDGFFHEVLNEPPEDRARVTADIVAWLNAHTQPATQAR